MKLSLLPHEYSVCKLRSLPLLPEPDEFFSLSVTADEISLVCRSDQVPAVTTEVETGWRCLKIDGVLDFSMVGVIAKISALLAEASISIFVVSTFNTDYILVKNAQLDNTIEHLTHAKYNIEAHI